MRRENKADKELTLVDKSEIPLEDDPVDVDDEDVLSKVSACVVGSVIA